MIPWALCIPLILRLSSVLFLPQTFFQPDEFYQSLEPGHHLVFGYGYLSWEWKDLPPRTDHTWLDAVASGRMRGWIWPGVFAVIFKLLQSLQLDHTSLITLLPRIVGAVIAALTDFYTSQLARKLLGSGATAPALFLSLTSLFNAHLLPRLLSTSPETLLTTIALCHFPFDGPILSRSEEAKHLGPSNQVIAKKERDFPRNLGFLEMDKAGDQINIRDSLVVSTGLAGLALCIRPTTAVFWGFLGLHLIYRRLMSRGPKAAGRAIFQSTLSVIVVVSASCYLDYAVTGRFYISAFTFVYHNVYQNLSAFYGSTNKLYHLNQSVPILLFPIWWWAIKGFLSCLLPSSMLPRSFASPPRPYPMRTLARAILISIAVLSLSPHSEWRFLHPWLPPLFVFAIPPLTASHKPTMMGCYQFGRSLRQYTRIPAQSFYLVLITPIIPYLYLNVLHGRAQVGVIDVLRAEGDSLSGLVVLMPCHSTPWMSHLHRDVAAWFLTCDPPLGNESEIHNTQQSMFYDQPVTYLQNVFPFPPVLLHDIPKVTAGPILPSHVILFGELLRREENGRKVSRALDDLGYSEVWNGWNGFDLLQDEALRRGGVRIWKLGKIR